MYGSLIKHADHGHAEIYPKGVEVNESKKSDYGQSYSARQ